MLSILDYTDDYPGVIYHQQVAVWQSICPDPNKLFKIPHLSTYQGQSNNELIKFRNKYLGKSLSLQYNEPLNIVRGHGAFLIDNHGRAYLDTINNVAHVGHEHFKVVTAGQQQMALLNTNSRYLHTNILELTNELLKTLPPSLNVIHLVNSGSEANELAIRMAKTATGQTDIIASQHGYHGNTNMCIEISSYKFDGSGGQGRPPHTHIFPSKPLGNGHPVAAVACTREIAHKFANGMEYFNTFGGNPVSCSIATEVLQIVHREHLQLHALTVGTYLKEKLKTLAHLYPIIGDVRGQGLFLGFELVDQHLNPLPIQTDYLINRMKNFGILMSSDGPEHNVIKIKPPLVFTIGHADEVLKYLDLVLQENLMQLK
ncbi:UNVERIFIED_CONTAM: hypothetical protein GTU68_000462 [Idotea baltica]|nr:hypothetical protein [Idotea baltica]